MGAGVTHQDIVAIERACTRLIARYANLNDMADWGAVAALYTDDGRFARPSAPDIWIEGRAAILASLGARPVRKARHLCSNIVIDVLNLHEALGQSAIALFAEGQPPVVGGYEDRFRKVGDDWLFAERRGTIAF